jgi:triacylglycerol lipase
MAISDLNFKERSLLFAKLSSIAYADPAALKKAILAILGTKTLPKIKFYDRDGAQAYRIETKTDIIIACRGTEPTQFNDVKADLRAVPVLAETVGRVHVGFKSEVDDLWPMIKDDLQNSSKKALWFTGHSLGAAMTTIMAARCNLDPLMPNIQEVYTYGSPRVGWSKYVASLDVPHHRWVNNNDIVTRVPLAIMGYRHHGTEHYMNAYGQVRNPTGWQRVKDRWRGMKMGFAKGGVDSFSDHLMDQYIANLENWLKE